MNPRSHGRADVDCAIDRAVALLDASIGMRPDRTFRNRLWRGITDEAATHALDVHDYVDLLGADRGALQELADRVTVQETAFFRHPTQFEALVRDVLPAVRKPVTIWCSASSNGQEAYSLAMILEERGVPGTVLASDISTTALARTAAGWYTDRELSGLSAERRRRHLDPGHEGWTVTAKVRDRVQTMRHNLLDPIPDVVATCQIVFCRNVLIYFSGERAGVFLGQLADRMPSDAYLFVGGGETLWQFTDRFTPVRLGGAFVYRPGAAVPTYEPPAAPIARTPRRALRPASAPPPPPRRRVMPSTAADHERQGHAALEEGAHVEAIAAFRKWAYVQPGDVMAHFNLGLALERSGDRESARAAFMSARAELRDCDPVEIESALGGYRIEELARLLDHKLTAYAP